jgi:hypothetical protein
MALAVGARMLEQIVEQVDRVHHQRRLARGEQLGGERVVLERPVGRHARVDHLPAGQLGQPRREGLVFIDAEPERLTIADHQDLARLRRRQLRPAQAGAVDADLAGWVLAQREALAGMRAQASAEPRIGLVQVQMREGSAVARVEAGLDQAGPEREPEHPLQPTAPLRMGAAAASRW